VTKQEHWVFSQEDAELIGKPLGRILDRLGVMKNLGKFADPLALIYGVTLTVVPRVVESGRLSKERRDAKRGTVSTENAQRPVQAGNVRPPADRTEGATSGSYRLPVGKSDTLDDVIPASDSGPVGDAG
jgi:hypothetical protein